MIQQPSIGVTLVFCRGLVSEAFPSLLSRCLCWSTGKGNRATLVSPTPSAPAPPWAALLPGRAPSTPRSSSTLCSTSRCTPWPPPPTHTPHRHTSRGWRRSVLQNTRGRCCLHARTATTNGETLLLFWLKVSRPHSFSLHVAPVSPSSLYGSPSPSSSEVSDMTRNPRVSCTSSVVTVRWTPLRCCLSCSSVPRHCSLQLPVHGFYSVEAELKTACARCSGGPWSPLSHL